MTFWRARPHVTLEAPVLLANVEGLDGAMPI